MRTIVGCVVFWSVLSSTVAVRADETTDAERIALLIQKLSSAKFHERERADRDLRRIGEPALKQLREARHATDNEVRERVSAAIESIEQKLENNRLLMAPKIRLQYEKLPLDQAIADLAKKTGLNYQLDAKSGKDPKQALTMDTGEVPYWEAVEKFLAASGLMEAISTASVTAPGASPFDQTPQQMRGFRGRIDRGPRTATVMTMRLVEAKSPLSAATATLIRVKALPGGVQGNSLAKGSNHTILQLEVTPAPSLVWQGVVNVDVRRVIDERGIALAQSHTHNVNQTSNTAWTNGGAVQIIQQGQGQIVIQGNVQIWTNGEAPATPNQSNPRHVPVTLIAKEPHGRVLKELEGVITAEVLTPPEPILSMDQISKVATNNIVRKGDYQLQLEERTDINANQLRLRVRLQMPTQNALMAFQQGGPGMVLTQNNGTNGSPIVQIQDASGKPVNAGMQVVEQSFDGMRQSTVYLLTISKQNGVPEPVKLVVVGRRVATVEVPFVLSNVPLP